MQLGTGLFTCQQRPDDDRETSDIYDEMLELGEVIDNAGLDSAWVSEHHFLDDDYLSGVTPALGALAAVTDDIEIGPASHSRRCTIRSGSPRISQRWTRSPVAERRSDGNRVQRLRV